VPAPVPDRSPARVVAHLTTVDLSLRLLLAAQLRASVARGDVVLGISAPGPDVAAVEALGVRHVPLTSSTRRHDLLGDLRAARELWGVLRTETVDVLHTHNPKPGIYGRVLGRLAGVPLVVHTTHGLYASPDDRFAKRAVVYALEAVAARFSDVELVQSVEDLALMRRLRIAPRRKLRLLGNGVDLARFDRATVPDADRRAVRAEWGMGDDEVVVGLVARLVAEKGVGELLEAHARLGPPFRLVLVGPDDPDARDALDRATIRAAEDAAVVLAGRRDDIPRCLAAMDVFCLPSAREGFPRAAMEASAMGLPVVAYDIRGCRQVVDDGTTGRLVALHDVAALADAIAELADPERRAALGAAAAAKARADFDDREVVRRVLAAHDVAPRRRPRRRRRRS
jgi:glycosyltransferase involved in cell wall biosynthesis